jgi:hypothetical protein
MSEEVKMVMTGTLRALEMAGEMGVNVTLYASEARGLLAEIAQLRARAEASDADAERLAKALQKIEWSGEDQSALLYAAICPICTKSPDEGHASDCAIGAVLAAHKALKDGPP